ncbi:sensor histidine kinase [Bacillus sp. 1P06AnD]|uniref:sensor histidine kinase n=1 Tax=Bacillus sp. 1P06AnD TaxID=3132208 RepID=UPI00399F6C3D
MRFTIQYKILIPFSIILFIGLSSLLFVSNNINKKHTLQTIENDMISSKKNLDVYLTQYFLMNNIELDEKSLIGENGNISSLLSSQMGGRVEVFDSSGTKKESSPNIDKEVGEDLKKALRGETAYSINYLENKVIVTLSFPIKSYENIVGFIRYSKDYTEIFDYNNEFNNLIHFFAVLIFIFIFITSFILSRRITKPVRQLIKSSEQLSVGNYDIDIPIKTRDEMGELAERFTKMAERIKEQIDMIEKDRDTIKKVQAQNKAFFDNVTHELKTPLTTILGYSQVLKDNGFTDKAFFNKGLSYMISESKRLNDLVIDILELSKSTSIKYTYFFENVNLSELIKATANEMEIKAKRYNITILSDVQNNLMKIGDKSKLKEVLLNLIDNAIKYSRVNSSVRVLAYKEGKKILIKVKDEGEGIKEEYLDRLFEPFYRAPQRTVGEKGSSGLGLAIVKSIIERHGGSIQIKSEHSKGTEVIVELEGSDCN